MRWASAEEAKKFERVSDRAALASHTAPPDNPILLPRFILDCDPIPWLLCGTQTGESEKTPPLAVLSLTDLSDSRVWKLVFSFYPVMAVDAARWWRQTLPDIPPDGLMKAFGLGDNHKSLADWNEMSLLDESAAELARSHELPLNVLRLWNRLPAKDRNTWQEIWESHPIKRNLLREIIMDYYDLSPKDRAEVLRRCLEIARATQSPSTGSRAYELRDLVHTRRFPLFESMRSEIITLRRDLGAPPWLRIEIPGDLESHPLQLQVDLKDDRSVDRLHEFLSEEENREALRRIIRKI